MIAWYGVLEQNPFGAIKKMNINFFADLFCLAFTGSGDFGVFHIIESLFDSGSYR
jgi:hypothetical protein